MPTSSNLCVVRELVQDSLVGWVQFLGYFDLQGQEFESKEEEMRREMRTLSLVIFFSKSYKFIPHSEERGCKFPVLCFAFLVCQMYRERETVDVSPFVEQSAAVSHPGREFFPI